MEIITQILHIIKNHNNYNEVLVVGTTFTGTVLAIFFTLISLPLQNILSRYSQDLIKRVRKDFIFVGSFVFLAATFVFNLVLIGLGATPELIAASIGLSILSMLVFTLLIIRTFKLLDVRNQLSEISNEITRQIEKKIISSEKRRENSITQKNS
jgi:divalent metal cation (Fe/Co/Zn/Cd) transporter